MPAVLFVTLPLEGHLRPVAAVAAALQSLGGGEVEFAGLEQSRGTVEALGVPFVSLGSLDAAQQPAGHAGFDTSRPLPPLPKFAANAAAAFTGREEQMYPLLQAFLEQAGPGRYAALCCDQATLAAHDAAAELGLPLVLLHQLPLSYALAMAGRNEYNLPAGVPVQLPCTVLPQDMGWLRSVLVNPRLKRRAATQLTEAYAAQRTLVRQRLGLEPLQPGHGPYQPPPGVPRLLNVVGGVPELEVERPLPPGWHMPGPHGLPSEPAQLDPHKDADLAAFLAAAADAGEPVVYVALGSLVAPHAELVAAMAAAFEAVPGARFVWSLKQASHAHLPPHRAPPPPAPPGSAVSAGGPGKGRVLVLAWAPQAALLAHRSVGLFVTHCGLGSMHEGLVAGKPLVGMPFFADQHANAQRVADRRLGLTVDTSPGALGSLPQRLAAAITALLGDAATAQRTAELGDRIRGMDGSNAAAALIKEFAARC